MSLIYVKHHPNPDVPFEYKELCEGRRILFFDPMVEWGQGRNEVADRFRRIEHELRNVDLVIFRGSTQDFALALQESEISIKQVLGSLPATALVGSKDNSSSVGYVSVPCSNPPQELELPTIEVLREAEIRSILQRSKAIFSPYDHHFILPSGFHAPEFIRLADALQDPIEIIRIADWIFPYLSKRTMIIGDTGSLLPLLLTLQYRAMILFKWDIRIRTLSEYPIDKASLATVINEAEKEFSTLDHSILFLVSVNSSGNLIKRFDKLMNDEARAYSTLVVCNTNEDEKIPNGISLIFNPIKRWNNREECDLCGKSTAISIDERTYERVPGFQWKRFHIDEKLAKKHIKFWEAVDRTNAVLLHVDDPNYLEGGDIRHHGIYLDVVKLLEDDWFKRLIIKKLQSFKQFPNIVLIPKHRATEAVLRLVNKIFISADIWVVKGDLSISEKEKLRSLKATDKILIVDDALVTGTTLFQWIEAIYNISTSQPRVQAFVIVARPPDHRVSFAVRQRFRDRDTDDEMSLVTGYEIFLPLTGRSRCPWCRERDLLSRYLPLLKEQSSKEYAISRIRMLDSDKTGCPSLLSAENRPKEELRTGRSFFGDLMHPVAFAAVTAACQELRDKMNLPMGQGSVFQRFLKYIVTVINRRFGITLRIKKKDIFFQKTIVNVVDLSKHFNYYYDKLLLPAVLRTFTLKELRYPERESEIVEEIRKKDPNLSDPIMISEIAWSAVNERIPQQVAIELLEKANLNHPSVTMLKELLSDKFV